MLYKPLATLAFLLLLLAGASKAGAPPVRVVVLFDGGENAAKAVRAGDRVLAGPARVGRFAAVRLEVTPERAAELAREPGATVWPWTPPRMHDERSGQILAGALDASGRVTGPGYLAWLEAKGLAGADLPLVDVTDSGFDRGSTSDVPPEFADASGRSRVAYARDFTFDEDPHDVSGHGTLNASIVAGGPADGADANGFAWGLGVAPGAPLGSTRIFLDNGSFDVRAFYSALTAPAWRDGARVSSNSWGAPANLYTPDAIEYDAIVRDADPETPGNQEMVVVFSADNAGPGGTVEAPGTAKNVITVGAAESVRPGASACGVAAAAADSAFDVAFFSSGGPVDDGRAKPDLLAPGTHVAGTRSRDAAFRGDGVCLEGFPGDARRFAWSSGTSHAAPAVSGAAALLWARLEAQRGEAPSPALVKAWLLNTTRYLAGAGADDDLPSPRQGWGLLDLERALDDASRVVIDQTHVFTSQGQTHETVCAPADPSRPVRVTLAWTDAPGQPGTAPQVNDLDLEVEANGRLYRGNRFARDRSVDGGEPDTRNTVEGVWLEPGSGPLRVRVRARELAGDGVPGANGAAPDQDFALVVYNAEERAAPVLRVSAVEVEDGPIGPGGEARVRLSVENVGTAPAPAADVTLVSELPAARVLDGAERLPEIAPGETAVTARGFRVALDASVACGEPLGLAARAGEGPALPVALAAGATVEETLFEDDVEGAPRWTFRTTNRGATWVVAGDRPHGGAKHWFVPGLSVSGDGGITSEPIEIPADAVEVSFEFWHQYALERGFDGGIVEASWDGRTFVDLGPAIVEGGYARNISPLFGNPLGTRPAWTGGRLGAYERVRVDLTALAGRTIRLRLRAGADARTASAGWYTDDFRVTARRPACAAGGQLPAVASASYKKGKLKLKGTGLSAGTVVTINGRAMRLPATFRADKGVLRVKGEADALNLRPGLNVITVTESGRASLPFAIAF